MLAEKCSFVVRQYLEDVKIFKDPDAARDTLTNELDDIIEKLPKQESLTDETAQNEAAPVSKPRRVAEVSGGVRQISAPTTTGNAAERGSDVAPSEETAGDAGQQNFTAGAAKTAPVVGPAARNPDTIYYHGTNKSFEGMPSTSDPKFVTGQDSDYGPAAYFSNSTKAGFGQDPGGRVIEARLDTSNFVDTSVAEAIPEAKRDAVIKHLKTRRGADKKLVKVSAVADNKAEVSYTSPRRSTSEKPEAVSYTVDFSSHSKFLDTLMPALGRLRTAQNSRDTTDVRTALESAGFTGVVTDTGTTQGGSNVAVYDDTVMTPPSATPRKAPVVTKKPKKKVQKKPAAAAAAPTAPAQSPSAQKEQKRKDGNAVNAQQFKDSYNSSSLDDLKSNPALAEVVEFADYLNSLTDAQWAKITPTFGNDKNPFKAPSMDVEQIRGFIDNTLNEPDAPNVSTRTQTKLMPKSFKTGTEFVADVYHGTDTDIQDDFDASKLGENTGAGSAKEAFFFAGKGKTANGYAMVQSEKQKEGRLNKLRLVAKKFLKGDTLNAQDQQQLDLMLEKSKYVKDGVAFVKGLVAQAKKNPGLATTLSRTFASELRPGPRPNVQMQRIRMKNPLVKDFKGARFRDETYVSLIKKAKENGHDGVVLLNTYDVAGKTKDQITEADMDNIFAVFDTDNITNTFKERKDSNLFKRTSRQRAEANTFVSNDQDPMYTGFSTVDEGLDHIIKTGNKFEKQLASRIKQLAALGDYRFGIVNPDNGTTTLKPKDFEPSDPRLTGKERKAYGQRNYKSAMDIWAEAKPPAGLHTQIGAGDRDSANSVIMLNAQAGLDNDTFLHEMMHGITAQAISRVYSGDITSGPIYDLVAELDAIVEGVNKLSKKTTASALARRLGIEPDRAKWIKEVTEDGVGVSVDELVAYAFTDGDFQIYLDSIDMPGNNAAPVSAWSKFVDAIRSFMGFEFGKSPSTAANGTALERVLAVTDKLLDERVAMKTSQVAQRRGVTPNVNATMNPKLKRGEPGVSIDRTPGREAVRKVFGKAGYGDSAVEAYDTISGFASKPIANLQFLYDFIENQEKSSIKKSTTRLKRVKLL